MVWWLCLANTVQWAAGTTPSNTPHAACRNAPTGLCNALSALRHHVELDTTGLAFKAARPPPPCSWNDGPFSGVPLSNVKLTSWLLKPNHRSVLPTPNDQSMSVSWTPRCRASSDLQGAM